MNIRAKKDPTAADKFLKTEGGKMLRQKWAKDLVAEWGDFSGKGHSLSFSRRKRSMELLQRLRGLPDIKERLANEADFAEWENLEITTAVQLSTDPDAFAVYFGSNPKQEAAMSETERGLRDQFIADPGFTPHASYDWVMLAPEDASPFLLDKPLKTTDLDPGYRQRHFDITGEETVIKSDVHKVTGAMRSSGRVPLIVNPTP